MNCWLRKPRRYPIVICCVKAKSFAALNLRRAQIKRVSVLNPLQDGPKGELREKCFRIACTLRCFHIVRIQQSVLLSLTKAFIRSGDMLYLSR